MAARTDLGLPKSNGGSLREQLARTTLRNVRLQGHTYVELREDGKRLVFFCALCLAPCYSDSVLYDHLKGNLHAERLAAAKATLLKPNPWPFNDGLVFFHGLSEDGAKLLDTSNDNENRNDDENRLAIVSYGANLNPISNGHVSNCLGSRKNSKSGGAIIEYDQGHRDMDLSIHVDSCDLVIPAVLRKDEISDLPVTFIGVGQIAARFYELDGVSSGISKIWCEWLGKEDSGDEDTLMVPEHDFGVVIFGYDYDLGRKGLLDDLKHLLSSSPHSENDENNNSRKKRKSFSDPEDVSESLSNQYDSSGEESLSSNGSDLRLLLEKYDDSLMLSQVILSKSMRRELRRQQRVAAERMCDICQHKMLPGKDVAALMNRKTGRLACSSRNVNGAFHVYHISCLIHWILLCEYEIYTKDLVGPKVKPRRRRKVGAKCNGHARNGEIRATMNQINSVFCPECQGTGIDLDGDELEKPTVSLSEMFRYKIKACDARRAWMKSPEVLQRCSTGFHFPLQSEEVFQENVLPVKLLQFYRAE